MAALDYREAAAYLNLGVSTLRALVAAGEIAHTGTPGKHTFLEADLNDWLMRSRVPTKAERAGVTPLRRPSPVGLHVDPDEYEKLWGRGR